MNPDKNWESKLKYKLKIKNLLDTIVCIKQLFDKY